MKSLIKGKFRKLLNQFCQSRTDIVIRFSGSILGHITIKKARVYNVDDGFYTHYICMDIEVLISEKVVFGDQFFKDHLKKTPNLYSPTFNNLFKWFFPPSSSHILYKIDKITIKRL